MDEVLLGQIILVPYTFAPMDTVYCDGKEYPIMQYQALYSLLGNTFGGNVNTTFCVPNLKGFEPNPGVHYVIAMYGYYPTRS